MLAYINRCSYKEIEKRIQKFVDSHNEFYKGDLPMQIRNGRKASLKALIHSYRDYFYKYTNFPNWQEQKEVPEMLVSRESFGRMVGCHEKTAYNHLKFLSDIGVIIKKFNGTNKPLGVYLNPYFWVEECVLMPKFENFSKTTTPAFAPLIEKNLPDIFFNNIQKINNYYKADVETVEKYPSVAIDFTSPQFQDGYKINFSKKGNQQPAKTPKSGQNGSDTSKSGFGPEKLELPTKVSTKFSTDISLAGNVKNKGDATAVQDGVIQGVMPPEAPPKNSIEVKAWQLVDDFIGYALDTLWDSALISDKNLKRLRIKVMDGVFKNFRGKTTNETAIIDEYLTARQGIDKAADYLKRHKNSGWGFMNPLQYFDNEFYAKGNGGTFYTALKWVHDDKHKLTELRKQELYERIKKYMAVGKSPRGRKDLTSTLELSRYYSEYVLKHCGQFYHSQFVAFLANPNNLVHK